MSAIVHGNSRLTSGNVSLVSQSFTYEASGLVRASLEYVALASKRSAVERFFDIDSAPPVFPSAIDRGSLSTQRLYLVSKNMQQQAGLLRINAEYAGALLRANPLKQTERESPAGNFFMSEPFSEGGQGNLINIYSYTYTPIVHSISYVEVAGKSTITLKDPSIEEMYILVSFNSVWWRRAPEIGDNTLTTYSLPRQFFIDILNKIPVSTDEKINYISPSVREINKRWFL